MLTQNEINALSLSPTKKDFVQIWNELLEVAGKLSERWDPTSTNESDPGIVILKALTGIADKLNYNIDKNILEAFMPTAAQEDSMRKLCDMLGYNIKYYQSAQTEVTIKYYNSDPSKEEADAIAGQLPIPKFTVVTNSDQDISYFTTNQTPVYISANTPSCTIACMEGQIVKCESTNDNNVITANQISENRRFYLPETYIAENGIFVYNVYSSDGLSGSGLEDGAPWERVDNLNIQARGSRVFKFGFDSYESRPYIEFPEDYSSLFNDGIFIYYARTNGVNGNVSARTLTKLELPTGGNWSAVSAESFSVENPFAATTGANLETIKQAYNNFKKTIGTFETLVTCRDYMNKVYSMTDGNNKPLVSNILVTDIRNDINRAVTICSCDDAGIFYKETPMFEPEELIEEQLIPDNTPEYSQYTTDGKREEGALETEPFASESHAATKDPGEPELLGEPQVERIATEGNKPFFDGSNKASTQTFVVSDIGGSGATGQYVTRYTNWYIGSESKIPVFSDSWLSSLVSNEDKFDFNSLATGEVSAYDTDNNESDYWLITQGDKTFRTLLPITWAENKTVTMKEKWTQVVDKKYRRVDIERQTRDKIIENTSVKTVKKTPKISHFDLVFYPFKAYNQIKGNVRDIREVYDASFRYTDANFNTTDGIKTGLESGQAKTIAHTLMLPDHGHLVSINNYYRLNATITTNSKITSDEGALLIENIKIALANAFNMRELDFGEEIPFDSIVEVIEKADARIRVVSLNEPALYTTYSVYTGDKEGVPVIKEYAVASDWLTLEEAKVADRFDIDKVDRNGNVLSTYNTDEAKKWYNKLAVRNILAGRVPLFNYNETFKPSFSEGAYQVTTELTTGKPDVPDESFEPTESTPFTIYVKDDKTYTGRWDKDKGEAVYAETKVPDDYSNNIITTVGGNNITDITTSCEIAADLSGNIQDVTLANGEFIKFRAPNFTTIKTYPAYVNYHLALDKELLSEARNAEADSLFELINADWSDWTVTNKDIGWQKVLDYFENIDQTTQREVPYKKTFTLSQKISAYSPAKATSEDLCQSADNTSGQHINDGSGKCKHCGVSMLDTVIKGPIVVDIDNSATNTSASTPETLLAESGCVKISNNMVLNPDTNRYGIKANLTWTPEDGETAPDNTGPDLDIMLSFSNPFITDSAVLNSIKEAVNTRIDELRGSTINGMPALPTSCAWTISFDFECVPFEAASLAEWERFVKSETAKNIFGFSPTAESGTVLWRVYGEGYALGKYVLQSTEKLLKFDSNYFGLLPAIPLRGIYIISDIGKDPEAAIIKNNTEYRLRANEYLYIEYTPSTTTEDGASQELGAVSEVYGPGTIIRPSGFEAGGGLMDSSVYAAEGNTSFKTVTFETAYSPATRIDMQRFGANEQVEIRDFAKVELSKNSFKNTSGIWYYKNFNDCKELEELGDDPEAPRSYTLKDGECIFYTDANKTEFAYFTTGTQVTLEGNTTLKKFEIIDLATILDSGPQAIPWQYLSLLNDAKITFQEYQYVTLGPDDTLNKLTLVNNDKKCLSAQWQYCDNVEYTVAGADDSTVLSAINTFVGGNKGCGWEACSTLELDVSYSNAQTLRTGKVSTSITLSGASSGGDDTNKRLTIAPTDAKHTLSFKTNLPCQTGSSKINIDDVYFNPAKLERFELKVFATENPAIVETEPDKVVPYRGSNVTDLTQWQGTPLNTKDRSEIWTAVDLSKLKAAKAESDRDYALRLPVSVIPKTYGVFSVYVNYTSENANETPKTWIELAPGTSPEAVTLLHLKEEEAKQRFKAVTNGNKSSKLYLNAGINCIRVNTTGRLFIKTSSDANGVLYFDDLRLVECQQVEYVDTKKSIPLLTKGLNLKQLGYLATSDAGDSISDEVRKTLKAGYIAEALTVVELEASKHEAKFNKLYNEMLVAKDKLERIAKIELDIQNELTSLDETYPSRDGGVTDNEALAGLLTKYSEIEAALAREEELQEALAENKTVEDLEQQLAGLLEKLSTVEQQQQQLLVDLVTLRTTVMAAAVNFTDEDVLKDYSQAAISNEAIEAIKATSRALVEAEYNEHLAVLADNIEAVANQEDRVRLSTALSALQAEKESEARQKVATKVKQLVDTLENAEVNTLVESMYSAALDADYTTLDESLVELRKKLSTQGSDLLVAEIELAAGNREDTQLLALIAELKTLLTASASARITEITNLLNKVKALDGEPSNDVVSGIITDAKTLYTNITGDNKTQLTSILTAINELITKLDTTYTGILASLLESRDSQVLDITTKLKKTATQRAGYLTDITSFDGTKAYTSLPFGKNAVIAVWADIMVQDLAEAIDFVYAEISKAITELDDSVDESIFENLFVSNGNVRTVLENIADINSFKALLVRSKSLVTKQAQNLASQTLINSIGGLVQLQPKLLKAVEAIKNANKDKNAAIISTINQLLGATDPIKKYQLTRSLKEELDLVVEEDRQLLSILADLLCPSLLAIDRRLPKDDAEGFYAKLKTKVAGSSSSDGSIGAKYFLLGTVGSDHRIKGAINSLKEIFAKAYSIDNTLFEKLTKASMQEFKDWLVTVNSFSASLLPDSFVVSKKLTDGSEKVEGTIGTMLGLIDYLTQAKDIRGLDWTADNIADLIADLIETLDIDGQYRKYPQLLKELKTNLTNLAERPTSSPALSTLELERQLLADIREIDTNGDFYYTAPLEASLAIELNESNSALNTLMNPLTNFDINNINNSFVISKLDIDYLTDGIQIARSSRLN